MAKTLKLEWWNDCDLGDIYYAGGYKNVFYYETEIGKPSYEVEQQTQENGEAVDVILSQARKKIYQFEVFVPEYIVDALVDMALHDNIRLSTTDGLYASTIRNVEVSPEWESLTNECMAVVTIKFQQDDQLVDNACCSDLTVLACLTTCKTIAGFRDAHSLSPVNGSYYAESYNSKTIYQYTVGIGFIVSNCTETNPYIYNSELGYEMYWDGTIWRQIPVITSSGYTITGAGNTLSHVIGFALPNTYLQIYYSLDGGSTWTICGDPVSAVDFAAAGAFCELSGIQEALKIKVYMYNHNCQYQYSNVVTII